MTALQSDVYDAADPHYGSFSRAHAYRLEAPRRLLRSLLGERDDLLVLDVGGGTGVLLEPFAEGSTCVLLELSGSLARQAMQRDISPVITDIERGLPLGDGLVDVAVCSHTIEHVVGTDQLLAEINRVLKPDGRLVLTFPNVNQPLSWVMMILFDLPPKHSSRYKGVHVRDFTLRTMKRALQLNGFYVERVLGSRVAPFYNSRLSAFVARLLPRLSDDQTLLCARAGEPTPTPAVVEDVRQIFAP